MIEEPQAVRALPRNKAGYRVPWFVAYIDGQPDFRVVRENGINLAVHWNVCWICGSVLSAYKSFVVGPMCTVNRVSAEPPSHHDCAVWAAQVCPFLSRPSMRRRDTADIADRAKPAGVMIERNPGATAVWTTKKYTTFQADQGMQGVLFDIGAPTKVEWFAEGRPATRAEVLAAVESGLPALKEVCTSRRELIELDRQLQTALTLVPT